MDALDPLRARIGATNTALIVYWYAVHSVALDVARGEHADDAIRAVDVMRLVDAVASATDVELEILLVEVRDELIAFSIANAAGRN